MASFPSTLEVASVTNTQEQTEMPITKGEMLGAQSKSMISMARMWEASSKAMNLLLATKVKLNEQ